MSWLRGTGDLVCDAGRRAFGNAVSSSVSQVHGTRWRRSLRHTPCTLCSQPHCTGVCTKLPLLPAYSTSNQRLVHTSTNKRPTVTNDQKATPRRRQATTAPHSQSLRPQNATAGQSPKPVHSHSPYAFGASSARALGGNPQGVVGYTSPGCLPCGSWRRAARRACPWAVSRRVCTAWHGTHRVSRLLSWL